MLPGPIELRHYVSVPVPACSKFIKFSACHDIEALLFIQAS